MVSRLRIWWPNCQQLIERVKSNSGAACTCVATEYHYHDNDGCAIEVDLFNTDEITAQLSELLRAYRHFHLHGADMDGEERSHFEDRANLAEDTFRAMFRGRIEREEWILVDGTEDSVMRTLLSWAQEMGPRAMAGRQVTSTPTECSRLLMRLTSEPVSAREPTVWPYIRKIVFVLPTLY